MKILSATTKTQGSQINTCIILKFICGKGYPVYPYWTRIDRRHLIKEVLTCPSKDICIHTTSHIHTHTHTYTHTQSPLSRTCILGGPLKVWWDLCCGLYPYKPYSLLISTVSQHLARLESTPHLAMTKIYLKPPLCSGLLPSLTSYPGASSRKASHQQVMAPESTCQALLLKAQHKTVPVQVSC